MENIENIVEATGVADVSGVNNAIATDENLSVDAMYQQQTLPSLGRQIFSVVPMNGPTAALFNIRKKAGTTDFELVRNEVQVFSSSPISTGLSQEVVQDIRAQYGKEANVIIGTLLRGLANEQENTRTLEFLNANSLATPNLNLSDSLSAETNAFEISQRVHELVLKANSLNQRTYESFCVLPYTPAAAFAALNQYVGGMDKDERGLFIAEVGNTKYFMNPDATSTTAYVGLKDANNPSKSSAVFSPYASTVVESQNADTGAQVYNIFNRFAITASPLHEAGNEMLFKFDIIV